MTTVDIRILDARVADCLARLRHPRQCRSRPAGLRGRPCGARSLVRRS